MPELPDLLYIQHYLRQNIAGKTVSAATVAQPVVVRNLVPEPFEGSLKGTRVADVVLHGPFLRFSFDRRLSLVVNLMLAGKIQHQRPGEKAEGYRCCSLALDDGTSLHLCDAKKMAKVYLARNEDLGRIPRYGVQGIDILSDAFTADRFRQLASRNGRKQVRVFINDHTLLSAIGNAYADEILFEAKIHPKTFVGRLNPDEIEALFRAVRAVMDWGRKEVEAASQPIHVKVRDHMRVRNRKGEACPRCGATIRREGVRGHDVFFCPSCQPASRKLFIDWNARH